jgi:glycogen operon protein
MMMDSLRYWVEQTHVDGFRFDLATILAREPSGFDSQSGFLKACTQDPVLRQVKMIAEPWDCGPGGYQVGGFPPGWGEWNGKYRDAVRRFWKGDAAASDLAPRLAGSGDLFNYNGRRPYCSVNFITAHDGFTLNDLVTYNEKHNEANGENNQDGSSDNASWNCGTEGPTDDAEINRLRMRQLKNFLGTLLLSQGTPMLLAGDEFGRTQGGNNNAYCQDTEISWLNWQIGEKGNSLLQFTKKLTALRHRYPILRRNRFLNGEYFEELEVKDVTWINADGSEMQNDQWGDANMRCFGMLLDGRAPTTGLRQKGREATILLIVNAHTDAVNFTLPNTPGGGQWSLVIDTNQESIESDRSFEPSATYRVTSHSLLLLLREPD